MRSIMSVFGGGYMTASAEEDALSFYVQTKPGELVDLEVVARAAIAWSQAVRTVAQSLYPDSEIRVSLIAAKPGSSNWLAKIEHSKVNQAAERLRRGWDALPLIVRIGIGLAVVVPTTAEPTIDYWLGDDGFTETQKKQLREIVSESEKIPALEAPKRQMFKELQRDPKITGVGTGVPSGPEWKPKSIVPASQFAEADGLFDVQEQDPPERHVSQTLDVILVAPDLENAPRVWVFKQEGIPGRIRAIMKDKRFLDALERSAVKEQFRANIPMRIRLDIKMKYIDGEWKPARKGTVVAEVISPQFDPA